jgi:hypothetical protein
MHGTRLNVDEESEVRTFCTRTIPPHASREVEMLLPVQIAITGHKIAARYPPDLKETLAPWPANRLRLHSRLVLSSPEGIVFGMLMCGSVDKTSGNGVQSNI